MLQSSKPPTDIRSYKNRLRLASMGMSHGSLLLLCERTARDGLGTQRPRWTAEGIASDGRHFTVSGASIRKIKTAQRNQKVLVRGADGSERELILLQISGRTAYVCPEGKLRQAVDDPDLWVGFPIVYGRAAGRQLRRPLLLGSERLVVGSAPGRL